MLCVRNVPTCAQQKKYRIHVNRPVQRSHPDEHNTTHQTCGDAMFGGWFGTPFTLPVKHVWSIQTAPMQQQYMVLFDDQKDATSVVQTLRYYHGLKGQYPSDYIQMLELFNMTGRPNRGRWSPDGLAIEACEWMDIRDWAMMRSIGLIVISHIKPKVNMAIMTPIDAFDNIETSQEVFTEDFEWQL